MIISASRRTDIPAFYSQWFMNRLQAGFVYVQNPYNANRLAKVKLAPDVVDCIVFWTKNPQAMLGQLDRIDALGYRYYFQFTLTPYNKTIETFLPDKSEIIETFKRLSNRIGTSRVIWRYDPILINKELSFDYHLSMFHQMCETLADYTEQCIFSFVNLYGKIQKQLLGLGVSVLKNTEMHTLARGFADIAKGHKLKLATCSETIDLSIYGITQASCISQALIEQIIGCPLSVKKDNNQRLSCGCIESVDIGAYDSCSHGCTYCYARRNEALVNKNIEKHDSKSPLLIGYPRGDEKVTDRVGKSFKAAQTVLF
jgi:hypothetical protein